MTTPTLPNKDAIAEQLWSILTKFHGRITDEDYYDIPACQEAQKAVLDLLTTTANARIDDFIEATGLVHPPEWCALQDPKFKPCARCIIDDTLKRFIGGTS